VPVHDALGLAVLVLAAAGTVAAVVGLMRPRFMPAVRVLLRVITAVAGLQVIIGIVLVLMGNRPDQALHWLYGALTLASIPIAMAAGRRLGGRDERIWLAGGAVLTVLFSLRAIATG